METVLTLTSRTRRASNCLWATPTIFLPTPLWFDAETRPWTCLRDVDPRTMQTTDRCAECPRWQCNDTCHPQ
jgi:hypothetical protein